MVQPRSVVVVGAGIVGMCCALYLRRDGHAVTVLDPREPGDGASFGNAGIIATSQVAPLALRGVVKRLPKMLLDRHGPVTIRLAYLPRIAPWLLRLARTTTSSERVEAISTALAELLTHADDAYAELLRFAGAGDLYRRSGWLKVYSSAAAFDQTAEERDLMRWHGARFDVLNRDEVRQLEPALVPDFSRGLFFPDCGLVVNPKRLVETLAAAFVDHGGVIYREAARNVTAGNGGWEIATDGAGYRAEAVVIAAGAWSGPLAARLGARVPLDTERGYHLMFDMPQPGLRRPTMWGDHYLNLIPMELGLRLTAGVEFGGLKAKPDYRRIERLAGLARTLLPNLAPQPRSRWMGFRPSLPDSLPVLGSSARHAGVYFAFGHQHLGLTLGAVSGRIIADLVAGRAPGIDLAPYRAERW
jgi:D-amino-acid dehydrogenase